MSGKSVDLLIWVEEKDLGYCDYAMKSLQEAMRWDEAVYGLEYDLDLYNIVAVDDFNMGAMENKSLNVFNTSCVLAHPDITTDMGFQRVEAVVAHEYFHNYSGTASPVALVSAQSERGFYGVARQGILGRHEFARCETR